MLDDGATVDPEPFPASAVSGDVVIMSRSECLVRGLAQGL